MTTALILSAAGLLAILLALSYTLSTSSVKIPAALTFIGVESIGAAAAIAHGYPVVVGLIMALVWTALYIIFLLFLGLLATALLTNAESDSDILFAAKFFACVAIAVTVAVVCIYVAKFYVTPAVAAIVG